MTKLLEVGRGVRRDGTELVITGADSRRYAFIFR